MNNTSRFCENCGASLAQGINFCEACGYPVKATSVQVGKSLDTSPPKQSYDKKSTPVPRSSFKTIIWVLVGVLLIWAGNEVYQMLTGTSTTINSSVINSSDNPTVLTLPNGMEFVKIPAGEFDMGLLSSEQYWFEFIYPVHRVKISKAFYMGKYEVTQKQWRDVIGTNPSYFKGDNLPVENVSWNDASEFIKKLNEKEGVKKYRLPSEAEWEYAARAGTTSDYSFGDDESRLGDYAWYAENSGLRPPNKGDYFGYDKDDWMGLSWNGKTHDVGQKKPNPWGLFDMHGNVNEWVQDTYHSNYTGAPTDGSVWESESVSYRVFRYCSWFDYGAVCPLAVRNKLSPDSHHSDLGFRLVRDL